MQDSNEAEVKQNRVYIQGNSLIIDGMQIDDVKIVEHCEKFGNVDLERELVDIIQLGVMARRSVGIAGDLNYVDDTFKKLEQNFQNQLKETLGEGGKLETLVNERLGEGGSFDAIIKENFGENGMVIRELFNPDKEGTPLYMVKVDLKDQLKDINVKLERRVGEQKIIEKSPQKGIDFEKYCEDQLNYIARIHNDKLTATGTTIGSIKESKKGDFVLDLQDIDKRIVLETKDKKKIGLTEIQKELDEAIENRNAQYGIFVAKHKESLSDQIGWFHEYDGKHLVCAMQNGEEELASGEMLHLAYKWTRSRLSMNVNSTKEKIDPKFIQSQTNKISKLVDSLKTVKRE